LVYLLFFYLLHKLNLTYTVYVVHTLTFLPYFTRAMECSNGIDYSIEPICTGYDSERHDITCLSTSILDPYMRFANIIRRFGMSRSNGRGS
jgi:hypothetical protein